MLKRTFLFLIVTLWGAAGSVGRAQQPAEIDSTLLAYYKNCMSQILDPKVLSMADTLFDMSALKGDKRMQAVSLCTKVDHYFYSSHQHREDSLNLWIERVKRFARKEGQIRYYYFVWGVRQIGNYINQGEYNIAFLEAEKMLKEAEEEGYQAGISDCYYIISNIYIAKKVPAKALEYKLKEIEIIEKYDTDKYNISVRYSSVASLLIDQGELEEVPAYLERALEAAQTPYHEVHAKLHYVSYYIALNKLDKAGQMLKECQRMYATDKRLDNRRSYLHPIETAYYIATGRYNEALTAVDNWEAALEQKSESVSKNDIIVHRADIYWSMNRKGEAAALYRELLDRLEEEKVKTEEITAAEFAVLLDMQRLETEKKELEQLAKDKKLLNIRIILFLLSVLLLIVMIFLIYQRRFNRRLKRSRDELNEKNQVLQTAKDELKKAKERAEENSQLKTLFIQNMSHEIRTPLNSIVGFSTVLTDMFSDGDDEIKLYSSTIENNSRLLLKMINDILNLSGLDDPGMEVDLQPVDVDLYCKLAIEETKSLLREEVELISHTESIKEVVVESNGEMIMQVLRNLLDNAVKFTPQGSIIFECQYDKEKQELQFVVADTGIGIPVEMHEMMFERFAKQDDFTQGAGLGLPICRLIAEKLGGTVYIDKQYTGGARFVFTTPVGTLVN